MQLVAPKHGQQADRAVVEPCLCTYMLEHPAEQQPGL